VAQLTFHAAQTGTGSGALIGQALRAGRSAAGPAVCSTEVDAARLRVTGDGDNVLQAIGRCQRVARRIGALLTVQISTLEGVPAEQRVAA
jgi:hypothetical protein